jgi:hypothetical protein
VDIAQRHTGRAWNENVTIFKVAQHDLITLLLKAVFIATAADRYPRLLPRTQLQIAVDLADDQMRGLACFKTLINTHVYAPG